MKAPSKKPLTLRAAQQSVLQLLRDLQDPGDRTELLDFCANLASFLAPATIDPSPGDDHGDFSGSESAKEGEGDPPTDGPLPLHVPTLAELDEWNDAREELMLMAGHVREELGANVSATMTDENVVVPIGLEVDSAKCASKSEFDDLRPELMEHVDGFLFDDDDIDDLGLPRFECVKCKSREVTPLDLFSHSMTRDQLEYLFLRFFRKSNLSFLDIGCRTGAVLYAAALYTTSKQIHGIELSSAWNQLTARVLASSCPKSWSSRIQLHTGDVETFPDLVVTSNVIFMNNVFEFFADLPRQRELWSYLVQLWLQDFGVTKVQYLVTVPSLEEQWATCGFAREQPGLVERFDRRYERVHYVQGDVAKIAVYKVR
ncbi:hypothetical protein BCR44DRAFT_39278 [Catenaria anguillulae PL171]|uniref:Methyltransferase type 11 domain-containing protein n=1 Tax=Catenaria anguillulae PL171 TaxID=765915 RepID=A0A1Y2I476_9FUNG|nr:hypothetical protein BCR44DRAFT_39278 [Catenaria anguillulae PL171]